VNLYCAGQKYLLKELRRHLEQETSLSQQLQSQLASFDRQTRNYSPSLTMELPPSAQNSTVVSTRVASSYPPDVLVVLGDRSFDRSNRTANSGNQHVPAAEARQSEETARAVGTSYHLLSPNYYSEDESHASGSPSAGDNRFSDEDEEFDATDRVDDRNAEDFDDDDEVVEYSNDESFVDDDFRSRGYQEDFDSDNHSEPLVGPEEAYSDSDNESHDSRHDDVHTDWPQRALQDIEEEDNDDDDIVQTDRMTGGSSHTAQDACDVCTDHPATGHDTAGLEEDRVSDRLRLNMSVRDGWSGAAVQTSPAGIAAADDDDDVSGDEDKRPSCHDDQLSNDSDSEPSYRQTSPRRYRYIRSSTSSSPSLHADGDELYSPLSDVHDADSGVNARRETSAGASSEQQNLQSHSDAGREQISHPVSRASTPASARSSVCERRRAGNISSDSTTDDQRWYDTSADSDDNSAPPPAPRHRRGVKRRRRQSVSSATDSDSARDTDADRRRHKLHRFR